MKNDFKMDDKMRKVLDSYTINSSLDKKKEETLTILKEYLPINKKVTTVGTLLNLLRLALKELLATSKLHYAILITLMLVLFPIVELSIDPYLMLFFMAPIPLFIGFWNIFGRGHLVMMDLEKTFKYSYTQILCSKIITITGVSILFLSVPITYLFLTGFHLETKSIFRLVMSGLTPIFTFAIYLLFITTVNRNDNVLTLSVLVWGFFGLASISTPVGDLLFGVHIVVYILLNALSISLLIGKIVRMLKNEGRCFVNL